MQKGVSIKTNAKREENLVQFTLDKDKCDVNSHIFLLRKKAVTFVMSQSKECHF